MLGLATPETLLGDIWELSPWQLVPDCAIVAFVCFVFKHGYGGVERKHVAVIFPAS